MDDEGWTRLSAADEPRPGDQIYLLNPHPWAEHTGRLVREETYGVLQKRGWLVKLDHGPKCYAQASEFSKAALKSAKRNT